MDLTSGFQLNSNKTDLIYDTDFTIKFNIQGVQKYMRKRIFLPFLQIAMVAHSVKK